MTKRSCGSAVFQSPTLGLEVAPTYLMIETLSGVRACSDARNVSVDSTALELQHSSPLANENSDIQGLVTETGANPPPQH